MQKNVLTIQYLRGIAAAIVVAYHLLSSPDTEYISQTTLGDFGVYIFFIISGFVMWYTTVEVGLTPFQFWHRRIIRIVPLYWFFLIMLVIAALLVPQAFNTTKLTLENSIKSFLFVPHYHIVQHIIAPILIPGWSLNYEMFFYFLFGLALFVNPLPARFFSLTAVLIGLMWAGQVFKPTNAILSTYTDLSLLLFVEGIILAIVYRSGRLTHPLLGLVLILSGLSWELAYFFKLTGFWPPEVFSLPVMLVVGGSIALESTARASPSALLRVIGDASYSIYLSHLFFLRLLQLGAQHFLSLGRGVAVDALYIVIAFALTIFGGVAVYYAVERPMISLFRAGGTRQDIRTSRVRTLVSARAPLPKGDQSDQQTV
jgi:exopolysaccharide production protein ExoZ